MTEDPQDPPSAPTDDWEDADPGLAAERTDMAWTRSSLAFAAVGIAILRLRPGLGIPILGFSVVVWLLGRLVRTPNDAQATARRALLVTVAVTMLAAAALVITFLGLSARGIRPR